MRRHSVLRRADRLAGGGARTAGEAQGQAYVKGGQTQLPSNEQACSARAAGATHSCLHVTPTAHHSPPSLSSAHYWAWYTPIEGSRLSRDLRGRLGFGGLGSFLPPTCCVTWAGRRCSEKGLLTGLSDSQPGDIWEARETAT